ncbi:hypothetical protein [Sphingomonas xinjiangensis]|uniref:Uncharacterized protein n=1 Tax=Sphingomonas xinjiangensis TaxID=643568 RepID=A0A840Y7V8_9SPHN|nr:hypothetical protein [Sphingomonas xinjiangensis]MBB5708944.1 hypothetical protein [Sphingomonas xinjiangensis]
MLRVLIARLAIGVAAVGAGGSVAGMGLANYVESGSFHFYKQPRMTAWNERPSGFDAASDEALPDTADARAFSADFRAGH